MAIQPATLFLLRTQINKDTKKGICSQIHTCLKINFLAQSLANREFKELKHSCLVSPALFSPAYPPPPHHGEIQTTERSHKTSLIN